VLEIYIEMNPNEISVKLNSSGDIFYQTSDFEKYISTLPQSVVEELGWSKISGYLGYTAGLTYGLATLSDREVPKPVIGAMYLGYFSGEELTPELYEIKQKVREAISSMPFTTAYDRLDSLLSQPENVLYEITEELKQYLLQRDPS
jgi:hypothetical protein